MALANKLQPAPGQPLPAQLLVQLQDSNAFIAWLQFVDPELNDDNLAALKSARLCSNAVFNVCQTEELLVTKLSKYIPEGSAMLIAAAYFKLRSASGPLPAQPSGHSKMPPHASESAQSSAFNPDSSPAVTFIGTATRAGLQAQCVSQRDILPGEALPSDGLSASQRTFLLTLCKALQATQYDPLVIQHISKLRLDVIKLLPVMVCELCDNKKATEATWRDDVFTKLVDPLRDKFQSNGDFVLRLLTPSKKDLPKTGVAKKQSAFKPDKVFAQCTAGLSSDFLEWFRSLDPNIEAGGLVLPWLVFEMKDAKNADKDLMKLPGEMLLYMQQQAMALAKMGAASVKIASRLPFCVGVHMDGEGCQFTFMSTELIDDTRRWIVLPKVKWRHSNSIVAVASAIAVLIDAGLRYWRSWATLATACLSRPLLAPASTIPGTTDDATDTASEADLSLHDLSALTDSLFRFEADLPKDLVPWARNVFLRRAADSCTIVKRYAATEEACWLADHELEVLSLLPARSPHFVQLLGAYSRPCGGRWLELELVPTKSRHFLAATLSEMQQYMRSLFEALVALHALGIVHGDLKQTNALFDEHQQRVRLIDFGNAQSAPFSGYIGGTPGYRAPETLRGFADLSADMYSAGCILASLMYQTVWRKDVCHALHNRTRKDCCLIVGREPVLWSEEAWDLMQRLLAPAHDVRPSATIALQHQYFIPHYDKPQRALTQ